MLKKLHCIWVITVLVFVYICIQSWSIQQLTVTYDEGLFSYYGATILKLNGNKDIVKFDSKLPITALNMLPRAVVQLFHPNLKRSDGYPDIIMGRYISLLFTVLLALFIYHWSALLYGKNAGLCSFIVFIVCPNFLAHGIFVSSDIFACFFMTGSLYFLWKFCKTGQTMQFLLMTFFTAMAQVSKFSMVHLFVLLPFLLSAAYFFRRRAAFELTLSKTRFFTLLFLFAFINWFVICAAHLFYGMFIPLGDYHFRSIVFQHFQLLMHPAGNWLRVPLPSSYVESLDFVIYLDHVGGGRPGSTIAPIYLLGKSSMDGFWYYYFIVFLYKLPLPVLFITGLTCIFFLKKRNGLSFLRNEMFLIIPAIYFFIYLNFFYSTQIGIRHMMIVLPLLYIFTGFLFQSLVSRSKGRYFCYVLLVYQCISVGLYFPDFLPYTNELITEKKMAYKKIADSNICYGEGGKYLTEYLRKNPEAKYLPPVICSGKIVMEVNEMLNINITTMGKYDWVRELTPSDHIHSQYLVFDVSPAVADSLQKKHF